MFDHFKQGKVDFHLLEKLKKLLALLILLILLESLGKRGRQRLERCFNNHWFFTWSPYKFPICGIIFHGLICLALLLSSIIHLNFQLILL